MSNRPAGTSVGSLWVCIVLSYCMTTSWAFVLWNKENHDLPNTGLFSPMNMCPMTDCGLIETKLQCAHQDRYVTLIEFMGLTCTGCPACRDFEYFVNLSGKTIQMSQSVLTKTTEYTDLLKRIKESVQYLRQQPSHPDISIEPPAAGDVADKVEELLEELSQKLHTLIEDSAMVKVSRYLEENAQELQDIVQYSTFLQNRMDLNINGFYGHFWLPSVQQFDIAMLPFFDRYRYAELLNDLVLDRLAELVYLVQRIQTSTEAIKRLTGSLKEDTNETRLDELEEQSPLMLRRIYQLLESNTEAFSAFTTATDLTELHKLADRLTESQQRQKTGKSDAQIK